MIKIIVSQLKKEFLIPEDNRKILSEENILKHKVHS